MADKEEAPRTGSTPRTDPEPETLTEPNTGPTAGDLRKAGYGVPDSVKDDEVPTSYTSSTVRTDPEPALVVHPSDDLVLHDKTPAEVAAEGTAKGGPEEVLIMTRTPAEQAKIDSKGSDAEKKGPRPKATTLNVTPAQAAGTPDPEA